MTPDQKIIVQETWQQLVPVADIAARLFYERLFEIDPATSTLFRKVDLKQQRASLVNALTHVVHALNDLERLVPQIEALGRRHADYGVTDAHYESVGAALLWTLQQGLNTAWTPEVRAAWAAAYALLSGVMRQAAAEAPVPEQAAA